MPAPAVDRRPCLGVLAVAHDRAVAGPELDGWLGEVDSAGRWLDALRAVCGDITGGAADASLGLLVLALALLRSLSAGVGLSSREVIDAAQAIADERGLGLMQVHVLGGMSALSRCPSAGIPPPEPAAAAACFRRVVYTIAGS